MPRRFAAFFRHRNSGRASAAASPPGASAADAPGGLAEDSERAVGERFPALVVGLGNPGAQYGETRHNVGARCVALLARRHGAALTRHGRVDRATIRLSEREIHLVRPRAYMNESGPPIAAERRRWALDRTQLLLVYDDLDLRTGRVRVRPGGGYGGNRGVKSVLDALGGTDVPRVRVGIDRPYDDGVPIRDPDRVADWVLSRPHQAERIVLDAAAERAADAIEFAALHGVEAAMRRFNQPDGTASPGAGENPSPLE